MAPHASLFSMASFYKEAPFQNMSNFRLFALYINHVFYERRITFLSYVFWEKEESCKTGSILQGTKQGINHLEQIQ